MCLDCAGISVDTSSSYFTVWVGTGTKLLVRVKLVYPQVEDILGRPFIRRKSNKITAFAVAPTNVSQKNLTNQIAGCYLFTVSNSGHLFSHRRLES